MVLRRPANRPDAQRLESDGRLSFGKVGLPWSNLAGISAGRVLWARNADAVSTR